MVEETQSQIQLPLTAEADEPPPIIVHVDMDCFYAACERLREPKLRDEPVVIGMGYEQEDPKGAVATASYEAREYGVESAMPISEALERLPRRADAASDIADEDTGYYRPVDMEFYKNISEDVHAILEEIADIFQPQSIDEAYLDVSQSWEWETAWSAASQLQTRIKDEVGVVGSIGIAPTKSAAKIASDYDKPEGLKLVPPGRVQDFFAPLDIDAVHGIGPKTADRLREIGIETAGDLAQADPVELEAKFGKRGIELHQRAKGIDPREVSPPDDPKSLSKESSTGDPITGMDTKRAKIKELAHKVTNRAREKGAMYQTVGIKIVKPPFDVNTRAHSLPGPIENDELATEIALELLEEFEEDPVRKLGVRLSNLSLSDRDQAVLDQWEDTEQTRSTDARADRAKTLPRTRVSSQSNQLTLWAFIENGAR